MEPFRLFTFLLVLCVTTLTGAAAADISLGSTLFTNSTPWTSPNNTFSLGFIPYQKNPSLYLVAITYGGIPVWSPTSNPADASAAFSLLADGNLRLANGSGSLLWQSGTSNSNVSSASLLDSGALVLLSNSSSTIWSSFDHPSNTILQSQNFTFGTSLRSGLYSFFLTATGNRTLQWNNSITYYTKGLNSSFSANKTLTSPTLILNTNGILSLSDAALPSSAVVAYSSDYGESGNLMRFIRLDDDGNLRAYDSPGGGVANARWAAVSDQCEVFGWCGNMGICSYTDDSASCGCPSENFEYVDQNDPRQGCKRKTEIQDCPGNSTMLQLDNTQFLTYPPQLSTEEFFVGITACRLNCLAGTSCVASTSLADGSGLCYLKVSNFVSGYQSKALPSTSFVKVCAPAMPNQPPSPAKSNGSSGLSDGVVAAVVVSVIFGLLALEVGLWWFFCRKGRGFRSPSARYALLEYASGAPVQFSYKELQSSTKGFEEKLGEGGFGAVYRGVLANKTVVAVKQLEGIEQGEKQFRMEVATISSTHHLNLVRLIGFCSEGRHRLLVYEFMKNGSLDNFIFSKESSRKLSWTTRFGIALGTARGITYLHEECRDCIVHCDIKPENILLDDNYNAKVSDFGLAKLVNTKDHRHRTLTSVRGTRGYLAPEWLANLSITSKSDVYSYGMVLLEIVSGRRNFDVSEETGRRKFSAWAYEEFDKGNIRGIVDSRLSDQEVDMEQAERVIQASFWCIQDQPSQRPSMGKVVQMLEGIIEIEKPPPLKSIDVPLSFTRGSGSALSTFAASPPVVSSGSGSSFPVTPGVSSSISKRNLDKGSSSKFASDHSVP